MDSKIVSKQIRSGIRPLLKENGFYRFTGRNSWRTRNGCIEVINFQSFNSYNAEILGCTTYSFSVNLGSYSTNIPDQNGITHIKTRDGQMLPEEYQCQFRGRLERQFYQQELQQRDIWYIDPKGVYLEKAIHDVRMLILKDALPWFDRLLDPSEVLRLLREDDEDMVKLWGFGRNPSPMRNYLVGYQALATGNKVLALEHLTKVVESGCFKSVAKDIEYEISKLA